jgi:hypothetical protein
MSDEVDLLEGIDLAVLEEAERRMHEVASVTKFKAQELLDLFNHAHLAASRARAVFLRASQKAESALEALAADIALNRAPAILKEKGLVSPRSPGGSEDLRQSVVQADPEYREMREQIIDLKAGVETFSVRARAMEKAFSAVKAVFLDKELPNPGVTHRMTPIDDDQQTAITSRQPTTHAAPAPSGRRGFAPAAYAR